MFVQFNFTFEAMLSFIMIGPIIKKKKTFQKQEWDPLSF